MKSKYIVLSVRLAIILVVLVGAFILVSYMGRSNQDSSDINASGTYIRGCQEKDCFPSVDQPKFLTVEEGSRVWLDDDEVIGLVYDGVAKAYPLKMVDYHHIVNDMFGDEPIAVTRCALCDTSVAYKRVIGGAETELGVLGTLLDSCLVMYDRGSNTSWTQIGGDAIDGELVGETLNAIELEHMTWGQWKEKYPDTLVLSKDTGGFMRGYDTNIYKLSKYTTNEEIHFPIRVNDNRLHPKEVVFGVKVGDNFKAYPRELVAEAGVINDKLERTDILVVYDLKTGLVRVFSRKIDGRVLSFEQTDGGVFDRETGSRWNFEGEAVSGEYRGKRLEKLYALESYWFAWSAYYPATDLFLAA